MDLFDQKGIQPMLIAEQVEPYDDDYSIFELKLDGCRCIAYCDKYSVDLRNKRDKKLFPHFPELEQIYKNCHSKRILDGEPIVPVNGRPDFYELQKRTLAQIPLRLGLPHPVIRQLLSSMTFYMQIEKPDATALNGAESNLIQINNRNSGIVSLPLHRTAGKDSV